jgi:hypothetical protein
MIFGPYGWILERFDNSHIGDRLDVGALAGIRQRRGERGVFGQVLKDQLMKYLVLSLALVGFAGAAVAQTKTAPASTAGTAGVQTRLQALHYGNVHDLRRGFDGQWVGTVTQGNVSKTVTITPDGTVIAR